MDIEQISEIRLTEINRLRSVCRSKDMAIKNAIEKIQMIGVTKWKDEQLVLFIIQEMSKSLG